MFCHQCGNRLPDDAVFCNGCGQRVANTPPPSHPFPSGRATIQLDNSALLSSPPYSSNPNNPTYPPTQFDPGSPSSSSYPATQFGSSPNNPSHPPTQFGSSPNNPAYPSTQLGSSPPYPPTQFGTSYPPGWQTSELAQPQQVGVSSPYPNTAQSLVATNGTQRTLLRLFGPNLAASAWFGVVLGGLFATVVGVVATMLLLSIAHAIAPHVNGQSGYGSGESIVDNALGIIPLYSLWRDSLQLFVTMLGAGIHRQYATATWTILAPLNGLLVLPALLLTYGGYIAASTDFQHRIRSSLWRGVAIAMPFTLLTLLLASQVNGCVPQSVNAPCVAVSSSTAYSGLSVDMLTLGIFSLLWGGLFGLLGASLKVGRGEWRRMLRYYASLSSRPQVVGMIVGGLAASGLGIALALLVLFSFVAYTSYSLPLLDRAVCLPSHDWQSLTLWSITQGPLYAVNLFLFSFGAPVTITNPPQQQCFYSTGVSISLFASNMLLSPWTRLLLALPVISLFLGGRVSAALSRVRGAGPAAIQGALIALPFAILMMLLTTISTISISYNSGSSTGSSAAYVLSAGVGAFDLLLWALLAGAVLGALGGIYQASNMKSGVGQVLSALIVPLVVLSRPGFLLLDRLTGQPPTDRRSSTRSLLYGAMLAALLMVVAAGIAGGAFIAFNQSLTFNDNVRIRDIVSVIVVAFPGLLLLWACGAALCREPLPAHNQHEQYAPAVQL